VPRGCQAVRQVAVESLCPRLKLTIAVHELAGAGDGAPASVQPNPRPDNQRRGQGTRLGPAPRAPRDLLRPGAVDGQAARRARSSRKVRAPPTLARAHSGPAHMHMCMDMCMCMCMHMCSVGPARLRGPATPHPRLGFSAPPLPTSHPPPAPALRPMRTTTRFARLPVGIGRVLVSGFTGSYLQGSCQ
jgi:hypothetical protein